MKMRGPDSTCDGGSRMVALSSERPRRRSADPDGSTTSSLKRIRIHPEAQRILGNSFIAIVCLERVKVPAVAGQIVPSTSLTPGVTLTRFPCQPHLKSLLVDSPHQNGSNSNALDMENTTNASPPAQPSVPLNPNTSDNTSSWTPKPLHCSPLEPEESSFHSRTHDDTPYTQSSWDHLAIAETTELELLHLDFDPDQDMVIQVDPDRESPALEGDQDQDVLLVLEDDALPEAEVVSRHLVEEAGDQRDPHCSLTQQEAVVLIPPDAVLSIKQVSIPPDAVLSIKQEAMVSQQPEAVVSRQQDAVVSRQPSDGQMESDDFCAVCLIGGELLCCDRCPKVFHLSCHVPSLVTFPTGDWLCTLCRSDQDPSEVYGCESPPSSGERRAPYTLSTRDQRRCEKLTLLLLCELLSAPFQQAVSPLARNYYQIIRRPMDLSLIRRKLDKSNTLHYFTPQHFVDDVLLMFRNCATFNYPDSEVARAGRDLEVLFLEQLRLVFSDQNFPAASQEGTNQARLHWLNRKRKENYRKKKNVFGGKKYFL